MMMTQRNDAAIVHKQQTSIGTIAVVEQENAITHLFIGNEKIPQSLQYGESNVTIEAFQQLHEWLAGKRQGFSLPLAPAGTAFMQKVWQQLLAIPYGTTMSYKEVAEAIGMPKAARAIGMANNRNPIPIIIPCHRIVGSNGALVGYRSGIALKAQLLELEKMVVKGLIQ